MNDIVKPDSMLGQLFNGSPESQQAMLQMGLSMMGPQQQGTNFGQNLIGSLGEGMNFLQRLEATRSEQEMERRKQALAEEVGGAQATLNLTTADNQSRELDQGDTQNAIRLFEAETDLAKSQMVFEASRQKTDAEQDPAKKILLEGLMKIQEQKVSNGLPFDFGQMMTMSNMIEAGWNPTVDKFVWNGTNFVMSTGILEDPDPETGEQPKSYTAVDPELITALGLDVEAIRTRDQKRLDDLKARSVSEVSQDNNPNLTPTLPEPPKEATEAETDILARQDRIAELSKSTSGNDRAVANIMRAQGISEEDARAQKGGK